MIKVSQLTKSFDDRVILKALDFTINRGETVAIIGPSGSGKSTLVRCLNLLEMPNSGKLQLDDIRFGCPTKDRKLINQVRKKSGMVFQSFNLFPHLTALNNVMIGLTSVQKVPKKVAREKAIQQLKDVGLGEHIDKYPEQLSGGQKQRVAIARSLVLKPSIILMDEPTSALDPELVNEVLNVIKMISDEAVTLVIVTHELTFARDVADRIMFLEAGEIVEFDRAEKIFYTPEKERTRRFLGNIIPPDYAI